MRISVPVMEAAGRMAVSAVLHLAESSSCQFWLPESQDYLKVFLLRRSRAPSALERLSKKTFK